MNKRVNDFIKSNPDVYRKMIRRQRSKHGSPLPALVGTAISAVIILGFIFKLNIFVVAIYVVVVSLLAIFKHLSDARKLVRADIEKGLRSGKLKVKARKTNSSNSTNRRKLPSLDLVFLVAAIIGIPGIIFMQNNANNPKDTESSHKGSFWYGQDGQVYVAGDQGVHTAGNITKDSANYWSSHGFKPINDPDPKCEPPEVSVSLGANNRINVNAPKYYTDSPEFKSQVLPLLHNLEGMNIDDHTKNMLDSIQKTMQEQALTACTRQLNH